MAESGQWCRPLLGFPTGFPARATISDPFDQLGLPASFALNAADLQRAYLARVGTLHPDRAKGETGDDTAAAAAALNRARATLADPEQRAEALLGRLCGPAAAANRTLPDGFLMEMMALRDAIDERLSASDAAAVEAHLAQAEGRRAGHIRRVGELFAEALATSTPDVERLKAIRRELNAWRYIERLIEQVESPERRA